MKRRQAITTIGAMATTPIAGCADSIESDGINSPTPTESNNPWGKAELVVGLDQRVNARHDIHEIIKESLAYWEQNSRTFAGYDISFRYRPNSDEADIQIVLVETIRTCGEHSGEYAGCSDLVEGQAPDTAVVRIVDGYRKEWMVKTLQHEIGHTLGLRHRDEPAHIMSNQIEDRIPDYDQRQEAIDLYFESFDPYNNASDTWSLGNEHWGNDQYTEAESAYADAYEYWSKARKLVDSARVIVEDLNEEEALGLLDEAYKDVDYSVKAANAAIKMTRAAQRENWDKADELVDESNRYIDESNKYDFYNYEEFVVALGFPRPG